MPNDSLKDTTNISGVEAAPPRIAKGKGGWRPGSGIKKGTKFKRTLDREEALKDYRIRVTKITDQLFNSQFTNAVGNVYIYQIVETGQGEKTKRKHVLVTDPTKIAEILDETGGDSGVVGEDYFIVTTEKPDNAAIKDMLDRTYGTATQTVVTEDPDGKKIPILTKIEF